jgi:hypothetical protein
LLKFLPTSHVVALFSSDTALPNTGVLQAHWRQPCAAILLLAWQAFIYFQVGVANRNAI